MEFHWPGNIWEGVVSSLLTHLKWLPLWMVKSSIFGGTKDHPGGLIWVMHPTVAPSYPVTSWVLYRYLFHIKPPSWIPFILMLKSHSILRLIVKWHWTKTPYDVWYLGLSTIKPVFLNRKSCSIPIFDDKTLSKSPFPFWWIPWNPYFWLSLIVVVLQIHHLSHI